MEDVQFWMLKINHEIINESVVELIFSINRKKIKDFIEE